MADMCNVKLGYAYGGDATVENGEVAIRRAEFGENLDTLRVIDDWKSYVVRSPADGGPTVVPIEQGTIIIIWEVRPEGRRWAALVPNAAEAWVSELEEVIPTGGGTYLADAIMSGVFSDLDSQFRELIDQFFADSAEGLVTDGEVGALINNGEATKDALGDEMDDDDSPLAQATTRRAVDPINVAKKDAYTIGLLDRVAADSARRGAGSAVTDYADAENRVYDWSTLTAGGAIPAANAQVANNRLYAINATLPAGVNIPMVPGDKFHASFLLYWKAGAGTAAYFGIDADAVGASPSAGLTNSMLYGINTSQARGSFIGSNMTGLATTAQLFGTTPTIDTTYVVDIEVDPAFITISYRAQGSSWILGYHYISRTLLAAAGKVANHLRLSLIDSRGLSGSSYSPVTITRSNQPARVRTVAGQTVEGAEHAYRGMYVTGSSPLDGMQVALPKTYDPRRPSPVCIVFHQTITGTQFTPWSDYRMWALTIALNDAGFIVVGVADQGDRYGNAASIANYLLALNTVRDQYNTQAGWFGIGISGGALPMLNMVNHRDCPTPSALVGIGACTNLYDIYTNPVAGPTHAPLIRAAYGIAPDGSDYAAKTAGYDPNLHEGWEYRGVPMRFFTANDDTACPRAEHADKFVALVAPWAREASVVTGTGGHLGPDQYQPTNVVPFFNKTRNASTPSTVPAPVFAPVIPELPVPGSSLPGRYYESQYLGQTLANQARTVGVVNFHPWFVPNPITIAELLFSIATAVSPSTCQVGIYTSDLRQNYPKDRLVATAAIDTSAIGTKTTTGLTTMLEPGLYWFAFLQVSGGSGITPGCTAGVAAIPTGGTTSAMGANTQGLGWDLAGQSALPASVTPSALTAGNAYRPRVQARIL